jgi:hypothetical protein
MGRIIMVVTVWLVMAAMMLVIAIPVIGKNANQPDGPGGGEGPPSLSGQAKPGTSSFVSHSDEGACVTHKGLTTEKTTGGGCEETTAPTTPSGA